MALRIDHAGFLTYAVDRDASGRIMFNYKRIPPSAGAKQQVRLLLACGVLLHTACIEALAQAPIDAWAIVPSTRRPGTHPLHGIVAEIMDLAHIPEFPLACAPAALGGTAHGAPTGGRFTSVLDPDGGGEVPRHVLLVDDTWTSGTNAQSAAITLKEGRVRQVSALIAARWINPMHEPSGERNGAIMERHWNQTEFAPELCPWTQGACPA